MPPVVEPSCGPVGPVAILEDLSHKVKAFAVAGSGVPDEGVKGIHLTIAKLSTHTYRQ